MISQRFLPLIQLALFFVLLSSSQLARTDSVGQIQTTKFFAPETVELLKTHLQNGQVGLQVGDTVNYIIQFTPIANSAVFGAGGYVSDYIPAGTEVIGAWIVQPDGNGGYTPVPPPQAGVMPNGWGLRGQKQYNSNWVPDATTLAICQTAGYNATYCNGRLSELYADTGIFYSTDPRTAGVTVPSTDGRIRQGGSSCGGNGLNIAAFNAARQLNALIPQSCASTHNLWDASMTNAFGTVSDEISTTAPTSSTPSYIGSLNGNATGVTPFNAGSPVAGPDTGYQLDYTGSVGPWKRIAYSGSMVGSNGSGPAIDASVSNPVVGGTATNAGWNLSASNPLPANTTAVRWAVGRLSVGALDYVKISLRVTAPIPASGLINGSEVFGGDASADEVDKGRDAPWRYHVPSVADSVSNLLVIKSIVGICSGNGSLTTALSCTPVASANQGATIPNDFVKIRYRILYLNSGNSLQTNAVIQDVLPKTSNNSVQTVYAGNVYIISGNDIRTNTLTPGSPSTISINAQSAVGSARSDVALTPITTPTSQQTVTFRSVSTIPGGNGGAFELDAVVANSPSTVLQNFSVVTNRANMVTTEVGSPGANSVISSTVVEKAQLTVAKTTSTPTLISGGTATYTITVNNVGNSDATSVQVDDFLPSTGANANDSSKRFNYLATTSIKIDGVSQTLITPTLTEPATTAPYSGLNRQQVTWTTGYTIPPRKAMEITFTATVGANVPAVTTAYTNDVRATFNGGSTNPLSVNGINLAPIVITSPLQITKTIECIYNTAQTVCTPYTGSGSMPSNAKVRYKIHYSNISGSAYTNVYLCDQLTATKTMSATISQPSIAPAHTDSPNIGAPALISAISGAETACAYTGSNTFAYPMIASLGAGASGNVYFDLDISATNNSELTNTAKIVSGSNIGISEVDISARNVANLLVTKTTSTPSIEINGVASYTITVKNTGNTAATGIKVYDWLPFTGSVDDSTKRFNYVTSSTVVSGGSMTAVTPTTVIKPTNQVVFNNDNMQEITWDFGTQMLAAGDTFTITFNAQAGSNIPSGDTIYYNGVWLDYITQGTTEKLTAGLNAAAPVIIPTGFTITKTIDCVYSGTACNPYDGLGIIPTNAKLRYKINYQNSSTTNTQTNVVLSDTLPTQTASNAVSNVSLVSGATPPSSTISPSNAGGAGNLTFSFATISSLAPSASGVVSFDVQTTASANTAVTNTTKIVSTENPAGKTATVTASAIDTPVMAISKTTSTPNRLVGETATYTISVKNTGSASTTGLRVYDYLPYSGSTLDTGKQFSYINTLSYTKNGVTISPTPTISAAATNVTSSFPPYNTNTNQQELKWDFGNTLSLAPNDTLTITFEAAVGASMPLGTYRNSVLVDFDSSAGGGIYTINNAALVTVSNVIALDGADAPASYGSPTHTVPTTPSVYLGNTAPDADSASNLSAWQAQTTATGDEGDNSADEGILQLLSSGLNRFPELTKGDTSYSVTLRCAGTGTVKGWIDLNGSGIFDNSEASSASVCSANAVTLTWASISVTANLSTYARFRIASNASEVSSASSTNATDGEVEDYVFTIGNPTSTITGNVFSDSGTGAGIANNALQDGTELGIFGVTVKLTDCNGVVYDSAITNGTGAYSFNTAVVLGLPKQICVEQTNLSGYSSTGNNVNNTKTGTNSSGATPASYSLDSSDKIGFTLNAETNYPKINFADVLAPRFFTDGLQTSFPANTLSYPHAFVAATAGTVSFDLGTATASPALNGWTETLYLDSDCNGELNGTEGNTRLTTSAISVSEADTVCIIHKEFVPANAPQGASNLVQVKATFSYSGSSLSPVVLTRQDLTNVSLVALFLQKKVNNFTVKPTPIDSDWKTSNTAKSGETLEYRISYTNNGATPIDGTTLIINDATPAYTTFISGLCETATAATPSELGTCNLSTKPAVGGEGALKWTFTPSGAVTAPKLMPGASGFVTYKVKLN